MVDVIAFRPRARVHSVLVADEAFGQGYDVVVVPPPDGIGHDREFGEYRKALAYARSLSDAMGWSLIDRTGGGEAA